MKEDKCFSTYSNAQQIKLMAEVLSKMGRFFNEMAEQCLAHLAKPQANSHKERMKLNKQNLKQIQNSKVIDKPDSQSKETYKSLKKDLVLKKIKSHKPKHPVSSFFFFYKDRGQAIAKTRGEVLGSKIAKVVGELWKNMSQSEKEPYEVKARIARQKYEQQMIQYKIKYTDELARLKQLKRKARILRKFQQDKKQQERQVPKASKGEQLRAKQIINQIQPHQNESSSEDSDLELEDDLSNSLSQILNNSLKEQITEGVSLPKQINARIQPQQAVKNTTQVESREKQSSSSSNQIRNYQESSSHEYHQTDINVSISNINAAPNQSSQQIQLLDKNQLQTLQQELKDADLIHQQMNQELIVKNPDQHCQIEDAILKPDNIQSPLQFVKPKGPVSSFFLFYRQKGKWISQTRGIALGPKAIKVASQIWKNLSDNEKKVYIQQARQSRKKYYEDKEQLKKKYGQNIFQKAKTTKSNKTKPKK